MRFEGTSAYVATDDLKVAVNAAITLERPLLISLGKLRTIVRMLPGLRLFLFRLPPRLLMRVLIPVLVFVSHCHLPSVRIGHSFKHRTVARFWTPAAIDSHDASMHPNYSLIISKCVSHYPRS